jgi:hypothetical protein
LITLPVHSGVNQGVLDMIQSIVIHAKK